MKYARNGVVQTYGIREKGMYLASTKDGKQTVEYTRWVGMLNRCYDIGTAKRLPTYIGCTVSDNFRNFQYFAKWCNEQIGFGNKGWHLDKDILIKGNKVYSEDNCVFVPPTLNYIVRGSYYGNIGLPLGVSRFRNKYQAQCGVDGTKVRIGTYESVNEAFVAYKTFKEALIKKSAEIWKNEIDVRVYNSLLKWEISVDD
jgi:hypothetical protein